MIRWIAISQRKRYALAIVASVASSLGGVLWSVLVNRPQEGGRGGAVGTAIAFFILFLRPDWGLILIEESRKIIPSALPREERLAMELDGLIRGLRANSGGQLRQNKALALASIIGTLIWGFGDWLAIWLIHLTSGN